DDVSMSSAMGSFSICLGADTPAVSAGYSTLVAHIAARSGRSNIQESNVFGVALNERASRLDVFTHQGRERLVRGRRVIESHLTQRARLRVHRGLPQLLEIGRASCRERVWSWRAAGPCIVQRH